MLGGCNGPGRAETAALKAGADAVLPCQERFHEETRTYADCVRYVANRIGGQPQGGAGPQAPTNAAAPLADWQRLGALTTGWSRADPLGLMGDADAAAAARELIREARPLQQSLGVSDDRLAALTGMPPGNFANRQNDLLAAP